MAMSVQAEENTCLDEAAALGKCSIQWYRLSSQCSLREPTLGANKRVYAPEPIDVKQLLQADIGSNGLKFTLTTNGPILQAMWIQRRRQFGNCFGSHKTGSHLCSFSSQSKKEMGHSSSPENMLLTPMDAIVMNDARFKGNLHQRNAIHGSRAHSPNEKPKFCAQEALYQVQPNKQRA
ncbi:hypothetical protein STAS_18970 [Striga asiatica]|uniref:Stomatal closure-related actin-binding protein Ig domain-containing protein n=1 Tax=Striga asiatica TaxID=4170 RepID=A0A5A7QAC2_STRAF|nr:hypothetical protein STAS_18970 [Striga asiatica]